MTNAFDNILIQKVKDAASIVDVIGDFFELHRDGQQFECLCPFHDDRHMGSFKISPSRNIYKCFSCGAQGGPVDFLMEYEKLSFADAIRWLGKKYSIDVPGAREMKVKPSTPRIPTPPLPVLELPFSTVKENIKDTDNNLCRWLRSLPWSEDERERLERMLTLYFVGTINGMTVFWNIDTQGKVRTGKMMLYKPDGHRDKNARYNFDWVHSKLMRNRRAPDGSEIKGSATIDPEKYDGVPCYFGSHLLADPRLANATINLVESEKTAIIMATAGGKLKDHVWIATGGEQFLSHKYMQPLIDMGRKIVAYPDKDGAKTWKARAKDIGYKHLTVYTEFLDKFWTPADGNKADVADVVVRMMNDRQEKILEIMKASNPAINILINNLDLEISNE